MPERAFEEHPLLYEDEDVKTLLYTHHEINIIGIILKNETITEYYRKYRKNWVGSWAKILEQYSEIKFDILHLHGFTSPIGRALVEAIKQHSSLVKIFASFHVPVTCAKGTLLFANKKKECRVTANRFICAACTISDKSNMPLPIAKVITKLLPGQLGETYPTSIRIKFLVSEFVKSFHTVNQHIDSWFVFSDQVQKNLLLNGVVANKINLIRHGVNIVYTLPDKDFLVKRLAKKPIIFLYAGRFDKVKGFHTLLKAWSLLKEDSNRVLKIIGDNQSGNEEINIDLFTVSKRSDVKLLGLQKPEELAAIMKESHCVIIPSEWIEIGPLLFHEAIATGCDVIAANLGGCAELASFYKSKTNLFESGNAKDLSKSIENFSYSGLRIPVNVEENNYAEVLKSYKDLLEI